MSSETDAITKAVVKAAYAAWAARDPDSTVANFADDCVYTMHVSTDVLPYGGTHRGKAAVAACLRAVLADYGFLAYAVDGLVVDGAMARAQIIFYYQHTDTGIQLDGRFRHVWRIVDGRVAELDEYHDVAKLKAFLDMVASLRAP